MNLFFKTMGCFITALLCCTDLHAAMTVEMDVQPRVIRVGEPAELRVTIRGVDNPPVPPVSPVNGLQINGPNVGTTFSSSMVNGRMTTDRATIFTYQVIALQAGDFQIGPYTYQVQNNSAKLPAISLKSLSPRAVDSEGEVQNAQQKPALFARLSTEKGKLYNQEVFDLYVEIFYRGDMNIGRDINLINMPTAGLTLQPFEEISPSREVVDNEIFEVRRFRCKANALTSGSFTLNPTLRIPLIVPRQRSRGSFFDDPFAEMFGGVRAQPVDVTPTPLTLDIIPLPERGKPAGFSGAVGQFDMNVEVKPTELEAGEPITVSTTISGTGNIDLITPPVIQETDQFKAYEVRRIENDVNAGNAAGRRVFEQVVIPKSDQAVSLPALTFSFFDPVKGGYEILRKGPFPLIVCKSTKNTAQLIQARAPGSETEAKLLASDLVYLKPAPAIWDKSEIIPLYQRTPFWVTTLIPPFTLSVIYLFLRRKTELRNNRAKARRLRAPKSAQAGLHKAAQALKHSNPAGYYDGIWECLSSYFGDRMNLAPGEVSSRHVIERCKEGGMQEEYVEKLQQLFEQCDEFRFGAKATHTVNTGLLTDELKSIPSMLKATERISL